jgi:hypothetical protein
MSAKALFRFLVAISLVLTLAPLAVTQFPGQVPEDWKTLLEWSGNGSIINEFVENRWLLFGVGIPLVVLAIYAQIGMFLFWRFARPAYAALAAVFVLLTAFWGISVLLPIEAAFGELSLLVDGAVIALSYSQPFSSYFEADTRNA